MSPSCLVSSEPILFGLHAFLAGGMRGCPDPQQGGPCLRGAMRSRAMPSVGHSRVRSLELDGEDMRKHLVWDVLLNPGRYPVSPMIRFVLQHLMILAPSGIPWFARLARLYLRQRGLEDP